MSKPHILFMLYMLFKTNISIYRKAPDHVICVTQPTSETKTGILSMTFDTETINSTLLFTFINDPIILTVKPRKSIKR